MLEFNLNKITTTADEEKFIQVLFKTLDMDYKKGLNFYDYIMLRNYNNAYDILLIKEKKVYFRNFPVAMHLICKNIKYYDIDDFIRIYNRIIPYGYFPHYEFMDFPTFVTVSNLFKLFFNNNAHTLGFLSYHDLLIVGQTTPTYKLIQNYSQIFVQNDMIYENLDRGIKMENLLFLNYQKNFTERYFKYLENSAEKMSVDHMFLLYRTFESFSNFNFTFPTNPFTLNQNNFTKVLTDPLYKNISSDIENSYTFSHSNAGSASKTIDKDEYMKFIFRTIDLNNDTYIEVYEILMLQKISSIFQILTENGKSLKNDVEIIPKLTNYYERNILPLSERDLDHLQFLNYKYNEEGSISFHQFLFLYLDRLRNTSKLIFKESIFPYFNYYGFYVSEDFQKEYISEFKLKSDDFVSYPLSLQKFMEFYSQNVK
jgi:hypothetical protein